MSFQQRNVTVSLVNFSLILAVLTVRVLWLIAADSFNPTQVFRLWGIVIVLAVLVTIFATILTHIVYTILQAIRTGDENPKVEDVEDERDQLIDLRGTQLTYLVSSLGALVAMLTFVLGQPPLVMFTLLIFAGVVAQIAGDLRRLYLYRRGF
jgi:hypothetical protein